MVLTGTKRWKYELTRKAYGETLVELGKENPRVVVLDADLAESTLTRFFREAFPERFFEMGIAEQNMVGTAAGLSLQGFIPFLSSYAIFITGRAWDQCRQDVDYQNTNVKLAAAHGGISVGKDGPTHQSMEDLACMTVCTNMTVLVPADYHETIKAVRWLPIMSGRSISSGVRRSRWSPANPRRSSAERATSSWTAPTAQ